MRTFSLLALPLFALSCATTSPEPIQVNHGIEVPEAWTNATQAAGQVDKAWWKEFGDEHLNQLVEHAFAHSPSLTSAAARVDRAIAQATIAGADVYPHLNAGFSASRQKNVFNFGSGTSSARTNTYGANLTASWEADVWGRIKAGHQAAFADLDAANAAYEGAALSLANLVVRAYFTAVASRMRVARYQESLDNALLIERAVQNRFEQGQRPITDVELIGATRAGAAAALAAAKRGLDYALRQLETLIGRYPDASVEIAERLPALPQAQVPAGVPADIVRRRPDLVEAERRLAAQNRRVAEAEASLYPRISLTASVGTSSDEVKDLLDGDFSVWSLAANLTAPIFQGGRLRATVDLNEASEEELRANFVGAVLNAWGEVEAALAADAFLEEQIVAMRENRTRSQSALKSADARYGQGQSDILTVLNARQTLYQAETDLVTIAAERLDARIALYVALGGGFDAETIYQSKNE